MIGYYAAGSGFGHVTRARRVIEALRIDATIVTSPADLPGLDRLIVDAFPGGLDGELCELDVPMDYVARLLRWDAYRAAVPRDLPHFETTWIVEDLTADHEAFVHAHSKRIERLDLQVPIASRDDVDDYWLVVHSGPEDEVRELVAYARDLDASARIVVASPHAVDGCEHVDAYPVTHLFPKAARIISAAGFNVMLETEAWRDKHSVVPFPRKFDDQFLRAARRRRSSSS